MTNKYKLAFFVMLRNNIMAKGLELGKSMDDIKYTAMKLRTAKSPIFAKLSLGTAGLMWRKFFSLD